MHGEDVSDIFSLDSVVNSVAMMGGGNTEMRFLLPDSSVCIFNQIEFILNGSFGDQMDRYAVYLVIVVIVVFGFSCDEFVGGVGCDG